MILMSKTVQTWLSRISPCPSVQPADSPSLSLCSHMETPTGWVEPKRVIYDHELVLFKRGVYQLQIDDVTYDCPESSFIIVPPHHWHISTCITKGYRYYAHFDWQHTKVPPDTPVMSFHPARPRRNRFRLAPDFIPTQLMQGTIQSPTVVYDLAEKLSLMLCSDSAHERLASRGVLTELLIRLLDPHPEHKGASNRQETLAHQVRSQLDQALSGASQSIAIRPLLSKMGNSYEHLARVFRQQYGLTPMDYVQSIRIERAKHLLRHTDMKILAVADRVGYEDAIYFSKLFKRLTGISPGQFRRI